MAINAYGCIMNFSNKDEEKFTYLCAVDRRYSILDFIFAAILVLM